jgi:hypothetical protein
MSISANLQAAYRATQATTAPTAKAPVTGDYSAQLQNKPLPTHSQQVESLLSQLSGKGQNLDIRV